MVTKWLYYFRCSKNTFSWNSHHYRFTGNHIHVFWKNILFKMTTKATRSPNISHQQVQKLTPVPYLTLSSYLNPYLALIANTIQHNPMIPAKFPGNTAMRLRVTVRKQNMTDGWTDRQTDGGFQYLSSWALGVAGDKTCIWLFSQVIGGYFGFKKTNFACILIVFHYICSKCTSLCIYMSGIILCLWITSYLYEVTSDTRGCHGDMCRSGDTTWFGWLLWLVGRSSVGVMSGALVVGRGVEQSNW